MPPLISRSQAASPPDIGTVAVREDAGGLSVVMSGRWNVYTVMAHESTIVGFRSRTAAKTRIDISGVTLLDTVAAIAVSRIERWMSRSGPVTIVGLRPGQRALLDEVKTVDSMPQPEAPKATPLDRVANLGKATVWLWREALALIAFFGELSTVFYRLALHPGRFRLTSTVSHMQAVGLNAMPIVGLLSFLVGIVLTFISGDQLQRFGAGIFIVNLVGIGVLRELGLMITAIIVAGRSGSAFTAEIGTMKINQEVDAMRTIGLDPMEILVVPRTLALMLMLVPLGFFADAVMIVGGMLMSKLTLGITLDEFLHQFRNSVSLTHLWIGMVKAPFFAFVIAMVGCFHGLQVAGSAESVGQHTTASVVQSIFLVITLDAIFAIIFEHVGW